MAFDDDDRRSHDPEHNPGEGQVRHAISTMTMNAQQLANGTFAPSEAYMWQMNWQANERGDPTPYPHLLLEDAEEKARAAALIQRAEGITEKINAEVEENVKAGRPPIEPEAYEFVMSMIQENIAKAFMARGLDQADKKGGGSVQWDVDLGRGVSLTVDVFFNPVGTVTDIHPVGFRVNAYQNSDLNTGTVTDMLLTLTGLTVEVYRD